MRLTYASGVSGPAKQSQERMYDLVLLPSCVISQCSTFLAPHHIAHVQLLQQQADSGHGLPYHTPKWSCLPRSGDQYVLTSVHSGGAAVVCGNTIPFAVSVPTHA